MMKICSKWLVLLIALIVILNLALFFLLPRYRFDAIVLHHSASVRDNYHSIRAYHMNWHWRLS